MKRAREEDLIVSSCSKWIKESKSERSKFNEYFTPSIEKDLFENINKSTSNGKSALQKQIMACTPDVSKYKPWDSTHSSSNWKDQGLAVPQFTLPMPKFDTEEFEIVKIGLLNEEEDAENNK